MIKSYPMESSKYGLFAAGIILGALVGALTVFLLVPNHPINLYQQYYNLENAVSVSPYDYVGELSSGTGKTLLVDLRNKKDYETAHFQGSVNIPAEELSPEQVIAAFKDLPREKTVVAFCYSSYCMLARKTGKLLADNGIYVKHLNVGWAELNRDFSKYVVNGSAAGNFATITIPTCTGSGALTC